jgi:hypothetical protein
MALSLHYRHPGLVLEFALPVAQLTTPTSLVPLNEPFDSPWSQTHDWCLEVLWQGWSVAMALVEAGTTTPALCGWILMLWATFSCVLHRSLSRGGRVEEALQSVEGDFAREKIFRIWNRRNDRLFSFRPEIFGPMILSSHTELVLNILNIIFKSRIWLYWVFYLTNCEPCTYIILTATWSLLLLEESRLLFYF